MVQGRRKAPLWRHVLPPLSYAFGAVLALSCGEASDANTMQGEGSPLDVDSANPTDLQWMDAAGPAPALGPQLVALTYAGGGGDQFIRTLRFEADGSVVAQGEGFALRYAADGTSGALEGNAAQPDTKSFSPRPGSPGDPGTAYNDLRNGLGYRVGHRQASGSLQLPIFRAFQGDRRLWGLWAHAAVDVQERALGADSRCYRAWAMPAGALGLQCWTDGGNSVLAKDPRDLASPGFDPAFAQGAFQSSPGGMASLYALIDPSGQGALLSGTFVASHVAPLAVDAWGRVYVAQTTQSRSTSADDIANPFQQSTEAESGFFVLDPSLKQMLANLRIGGDCDGGMQAFGSIALRGNLLALGGTTCAPDVPTRNAAQSQHGGGQDGLLAIVRLWQ